MKQNQIKPRQRILEATLTLFYQVGYSNTSVQDILDKAHTHKASFYRYFNHKSDLGLEYLLEQDKVLRDFFLSLSRRYLGATAFFTGWVRLLKRQAKSGSFFGCQVISFANTLEDEVILRKKADTIVQEWIKLFSQIISTWQVREGPRENFKLAQSIMTLYQGRAALYRATRNPRYLQNLDKEFLELI